MTEEELDRIHSAFWAGVDAARMGHNMIDAYSDLIDYLEERIENDREM